uniref:hypothetical protein n=1 Tax=Prevotella sp. TaxID=59823 RepID=UPI004025CA46
MKQQIEILDKSCTVYQRGEAPKMLLLQPVDEHDREELDTEMEWIVGHTTVDFRFIAVHVDRWFDELAPWPAPPVFGKTPFGNGAAKTLDSLRQIVSEEQQRMATSVEAMMKVIIGGYSLAGLFALWAGYQPDQPFDAVVAASPSVWYQDWLDYAAAHQPLFGTFYLSLGDREERSRTPILTTIASAIRRQQQLLEQAHVVNTLEWNSGNHFQDNGQRTAKGFVWTMENLLHC